MIEQEKKLKRMEYFTEFKKEEQSMYLYSEMEENEIATKQNAEEQNAEEIDHPSRYCKGKVECIDAIEAATSNLVGIQAVDTGAVIRYLWRWADKGGIQDLEKAKNYIDFLIKDIQENGIRK